MAELNRKNELLIIMQEECGEVTQAISKIFRFGEDSFHPKDRKKITNQKQMEMEIGDILGILKFLIEEGHVDGEVIMKSAEDKMENLHKYMNTQREE